MFLFGILSSPLPYLLMAAFYFIGFATGMFSVDADSEPDATIQVKNIQVESKTQGFEKSVDAFHFHEYKSQKKTDNCSISSVQPSPVGQNEKLIYVVHELKIPHSSTSEYYFCRPPPTRS